MARDVGDVVETTAKYTFSFLITTILLAFLIGVPLGSAARRMYTTMFHPDVVVSPTNQTQ